MKILFIHLEAHVFTALGHPRHHLAPVDLGTAMAVATDAGHDVQFIETSTGAWGRDDFLGELNRCDADAIVIKPAYDAVPFAGITAKAARAAERPVIWVGTAASHAAPEILNASPQCCVLRGEYEPVLPELLDACLGDGALESVPGLRALHIFCETFGRGLCEINTPEPRLIQDLDSLPAPRHDLLVEPAYRFFYPLKPKGALKMGYLLSSRGCPYSCTFCSEVERASFGTRYRRHSPGRVAAEMGTLAKLGVNGVYFEDDLLALQKKQFLEMTDAIGALGSPPSWCAQVRPSDIDDDIAKALAQSGCASVACGIESGSDRILKLLRKGTDVDAMRRGVRALRSAGVQVVAYVIVGTPGERPEERDATLKFVRELDASLVQVHIFASYPGTQAMEEFPELGGEGASKFVPSPSRADHDDLIRIQRRFYRSYYLRPDRLLRHAWRRAPRVMSDPKGELGMAWSIVKHALRSS